jgi:hypothetical protein
MRLRSTALAARSRPGLGLAMAILALFQSSGLVVGAGADLETVEELAKVTQLLFQSPEEEAVVSQTFDVHITVATPDIDRFAQVFNTTYLCLRLDNLPFSCWPFSYARMKFADVLEGPHQVRIVMTRA